MHHIVLGCHFGDEGKGRVADALASQCLEPPVVVRFSGGQQCGHTVLLGGKTHVHASYPAGTLRGLDGYVSEHCTISPRHLLCEYDALCDAGIVIPRLRIHPLAKVTTPWDINAGRQRERSLSHGSCGLGVGATMKRHLETPFKLVAADLFAPELLETKLRHFSCFGTIEEELLQEFLGQVGLFRELVTLADYRVLEGRPLIFEGSQGILLDMDHGIFPHVTYAHTTARNALDICSQLGIAPSRLSLHAVTRTYLTRHGNGPLHGECPKSDLGITNDAHETNVENPWQGKLRYAPLNLSLLQFALRVNNFGGRTVLHLTCCDQVPDPAQPRKLLGQTGLPVVSYHAAENDRICPPQAPSK